MGRGVANPFRIFGSPYTLSLHQHATYLRLKQLPYKVYCTNFTTTLLYALYYRAKHTFSTVAPSGTSHLQLWQLVEATELDEDLASLTTSGVADAAATGRRTLPPCQPQRMLLQKTTHPLLHLASWTTVVYSCWWLAKTGAVYRYVTGESRDVLEGYLRYFFIVPGVGLARTMAPKFQEVMQHIVAVTGVSKETAPYMDEHFYRMCQALESHFREHPDMTFLLGTPHPTMADVALGATFSGFFFMDDPPASIITEQYPCLTEYIWRVTGWRDGTFVGGDTAEKAAEGAIGSGGPAKSTSAFAAFHQSHSSYDDAVPESLASFFELQCEVFPFLMSQCASFNAFMSSDGVLSVRREALEGPWSGCHGYLFPQMTNIKSLMIIDDNVSTIQARAQDLEVAFLAAREVHDEGLSTFGREHCSVAPTADLNSRASSGVAEPIPPLVGVPASCNDSKANSLNQVLSLETALEGSSHLDSEGEQQRDGAEMRELASVFQNAQDVKNLDADDADFYRAYTKKGKRYFGGVATSLAGAIPAARSTASALRTRTSVLEHLETLHKMLKKMACPQYTVTSVFHRRRIYIAAIPEYEVAKVRRRASGSVTVSKAADEC